MSFKSKTLFYPIIVPRKQYAQKPPSPCTHSFSSLFSLSNLFSRYFFQKKKKNKMFTALLFSCLLAVSTAAPLQRYHFLMKNMISDDELHRFQAELEGMMEARGNERDTELFRELGLVVVLAELTQHTYTAAEGRWGNDPEGVVVAISRDRRVTQDSADVFSQSAFPNWGIARLFSDSPGLTHSSEPKAQSDGQGTVIYVLDTGVDCGHPEFSKPWLMAESCVVGPCYLTENNVQDGVMGCAVDDNGHGTHVASLAGGKGTSMAPSATIVSVKVMDAEGRGTLSDVLSAVKWVVDDYVSRGRPSSIINLSLSAVHSEVVNQVLDFVAAHGLHVTTAAGNSATDSCEVSPASSSNSITVSGTGLHMISGRAEDTHYSLSNTGHCVDIHAPAENMRGARHNTRDSTPEEDRYLVLSGTSTAAPMVSAMLAKYLSHNPGTEPEAAKRWLLASAQPATLVGLPENAGVPHSIAHYPTDAVLLPQAETLLTTENCFGDVTLLTQPGVLQYPETEEVYQRGVQKCWVFQCSGRVYMKFSRFALQLDRDQVHINSKRHFSGHMVDLRDASYGDTLMRFASDTTQSEDPSADTGFSLTWFCV